MSYPYPGGGNPGYPGGPPGGYPQQGGYPQPGGAPGYPQPGGPPGGYPQQGFGQQVSVKALHWSAYITLKCNLLPLHYCYNFNYGYIRSGLQKGLNLLCLIQLSCV